MDTKNILKSLVFNIGCFSILFSCYIVEAGWHIETIDSDTDVGKYSSLALDQNNNPHIIYFDDTNQNLKYAYFDGTWHTETVAEDISNSHEKISPSLALDSNDNPRVSYFDGRDNYKYTWCNSECWNIINWQTVIVVDGISSSGGHNSLALDSNDNPSISYNGYYDYSNDFLEYAWCDMECGNTNNWHTVSIDRVGDNTGFGYWKGHSSLALDSNDNPRISYSDQINDVLKYSWCDMECGNTNNWHIETIDTAGWHSSLAMDNNGNPHISYYQKTFNNDIIKYAYNYDDSWHTKTIDDHGEFNIALAIDSRNNSHISYGYDNVQYYYYDNNLNRKYIQTISEVGRYNSLSVDSNDNPHISYYDLTTHDLKYAYNFDLDDDSSNNDEDNCSIIYNPDQEDIDGDGVGDPCDDDVDGDGNLNETDNCPAVANPDQIDADGDGVGDVCDNCISDVNPTQTDTDGDCIGDVCDPAPYDYDPRQPDTDNDGIGDMCDVHPNHYDLLPAADGHYENYYYEECTYNGEYTSIEPGIEVTYNWEFGGGGMFCYYGFGSSLHNIGIMEFDISSVGGLFANGQTQAGLSLTVKDGDLPADDRCLSLYSIQDANENGVIEDVDIDTEDFIGEICGGLQPGDMITFNVTAAVEHDLFDPAQTIYSGFIIDKSTYWEGYIQFYDHTDPSYAPRLSVSDSDGIFIDDNCPLHYNPAQEDTYPPQGNGIGDTCDCEGNFDCDGDCDGSDASTFKVDFGRSTFDNPCEGGDPCNGDFDCDGDCDGTDAAGFKFDFGRSGFNNPCPACTVEDWCIYP